MSKIKRKKRNDKTKIIDKKPEMVEIIEEPEEFFQDSIIEDYVAVDGMAEGESL